jgi:hypothetical protein
VGRAVVHDPEHPAGAGIGFAGHHLLDQLAERVDSRCCGAAADHPGVVYVVAGQVGQGATTAVLELLTAHPTRRGWQVRVARVQGLELGFLLGADHVLVRAERLAVPAPVVEVEHSGGLDGEVRVTGEDPGPVAPRLDRIPRGSQRRTVEPDTVSTRPRVTASAANSATLQWANGTRSRPATRTPSPSPAPLRHQRRCRAGRCVPHAHDHVVGLGRPPAPPPRRRQPRSATISGMPSIFRLDQELAAAAAQRTSTRTLARTDQAHHRPPRRIRLHHRTSARRRTAAPMPTALRRIGHQLRLRDLPRQPRRLRTQHAPNRRVRRHPRRRPRLRLRPLPQRPHRLDPTSDEPTAETTS